MRTLLSTFKISVTALTLAFVACSGEAGSPGGGVLGADGLTPREIAGYRAELVPDCAYAIEAMLLVDCPLLGVTLDREYKSRTAFCREQVAGIPDECIIEADAYYSCVSGSRYRCTGTGVEHVDCDEETATLRQCLIEAP